MTESAIKEWQPLPDDDTRTKAPPGMIRAIKFIPGSNIAYLRDFRSVDEAIRIISLANDDIRTRAHLFNEEGHLLRCEFNPFTATIATDWRELTSMWPKAPKGMFRAVVGDTDAEFYVEMDFPSIEAATQASEAKLGDTWDGAYVVNENGDTVCDLSKADDNQDSADED